MAVAGNTLARVLFVCAIGVGCAKAQICSTPRNTRGECVDLRQCPSLLNIFKLKALDEKTTQYLQQSQCGYVNSTPKVCCETNAEPCKTPDNQPGTCSDLRSCEDLLDVLDRTPFLSDDVIEYLRTSECTNAGDRPKLCCPFVRRDVKQEIQNRANLLPDQNECGSQVFENKIKGGNTTDIYQYPWMVLLEYDGIDGTELSCGGSLISNRYVLTAAHCTAANSRNGKLARVRLGEYDTRNETDCKFFAFGERDCMPPIVQVEIEQVITHEQFNIRNRQHDIALLRLKHPVAYTEFVRPICLPSSQMVLPKKMTVAGWGDTEAGRASSVKLEVQVPVFDKSNCTSIYRSSSIAVNECQLCAGGEFGKDSCGGDSGGPLMTPVKSPEGFFWYQVGVVSFGPTPCARQGIPAIYTLVWRYYDWIIDNIRP